MAVDPMTAAYPIADEVLVEKVRALAAELGDWPSKRRVMRAAGVGAPRASAALATLRDEGFDPTPRRGLSVVPAGAETQPERVEERPEDGAPGVAEGAPDDTTEAVPEGAQIDTEPLVSGAAGAPTPQRARSVPRWPLLIIATGAFVAVWSGWVGLGRLTGFGPVALLPGIADEWVINSAITLPLGVEAYAAFAMWAWLSGAPVSARARTFARRSAVGALVLGAAGQIAYHLLTAAGVERAPWQITAGVSVLPVVVLGCAAALVHLLHAGRS
jgi:hypothetical protein